MDFRSSFLEKIADRKREAEEKDAARRAAKSGKDYLNLISIRVPTEIKAMRLVPEAEARRTLLVPLQFVRNMVVVAVFDPEKKETKELINKLMEDHDVRIVVSSMSSLNHALSYYKYVTGDTKSISGKVGIDDDRLQEIRGEITSLSDLSSLIKNFKSAYTSQVLEVLLGGAIALGSSDLHLEPAQGKGIIRARIDGLLHTVFDNFKPIIYKSLVTRIKLLSGLKINVTDAAQDGRFTIDLKDFDIEIRTSVIPSEYGETVVLRILDPNALKVHLEDLGLRKDDLVIVREEIKKPNGLILNTGPTGSGKTTTLYAFLRTVYSDEIKVITIEDPIEYHLEGISQTQVDKDSGYTFASGLRSILRQDPDVVLVGEIRDDETADIALNASLTGHLVFSTLHTNDSLGAVPRLLDLKVLSHILGPAMSLVIAQRLVRVLCESCKVKKTLTDKDRRLYAEFLNKLPGRVAKDDYSDFKIYEPKGCGECRGLGFKGRVGVFELFRVDEEMEQLIYKNPTEIELKKAARKQGMVLMQEDGILKVFSGTTSFSEVERVTGLINWRGES